MTVAADDDRRAPLPAGRRHAATETSIVARALTGAPGNPLAALAGGARCAREVLG